MEYYSLNFYSPDFYEDWMANIDDVDKSKLNDILCKLESDFHKTRWVKKDYLSAINKWNKKKRIDFIFGSIRVLESAIKSKLRINKDHKEFKSFLEELLITEKEDEENRLPISDFDNFLTTFLEMRENGTIGKVGNIKLSIFIENNFKTHYSQSTILRKIKERN